MPAEDNSKIWITNYQSAVPLCQSSQKTVRFGVLLGMKLTCCISGAVNTPRISIICNRECQRRIRQSLIWKHKLKESKRNWVKSLQDQGLVWHGFWIHFKHQTKLRTFSRSNQINPCWRPQKKFVNANLLYITFKTANCVSYIAAFQTIKEIRFKALDVSPNKEKN